MPPRRCQPKASEASQLTRLHDRIKILEKDVTIIRGHADVWKLKTEKAVEREKYILEEFRQIGEQLQFVNLISQDEKEYVDIRMNCLTQQELEAEGYFRIDRDRAIMVATVQDRVYQVLGS